MSIDLCDGKYHWHDDGASLACRRYGMEWRDFTGDKATRALFVYAEELRAENMELKKSIRLIRKQYRDNKLVDMFKTIKKALKE